MPAMPRMVRSEGIGFKSKIIGSRGIKRDAAAAGIQDKIQGIGKLSKRACSSNHATRKLS